MESAAIAAQLREIAIYFELEGDRHRAIAYRRAAASVHAAPGLPQLVENGRLEQLPHIGPSIARVIGDLARRGSSIILERLRERWPNVIVELAQLPYVGVTKAREIHRFLAPANLDAVAAAARAGALRGLKGFGELSERKLLTAIEASLRRATLALHIDAEAQARAIAEYLVAEPAVVQVEIAGPVRRGIDVVDHLAFAVACHAADPVVARFLAYAAVTRSDLPPHSLVGSAARPGAAGASDDGSHEHGGAITAWLGSGLRCELYLAPPSRFGWALVRATGSPAHVDLLRARRPDLDAIEARDETEFYRALELAVPPAEVRDGTDELSVDHSQLVTLGDITTAFHCHTTYSDGKDSILAMAEAAHAMGLNAITITDHSAAAAYASGLGADELRAQANEIASLHSPIRILHGTEADILVDGSIDVPPDLIGSLDLVIASIHQRFRLDDESMTQRIITAMRQPYFKIWGHATGRLVMRRDPIRVRIDDIFDVIAESQAAIELNGDPHRLDLDAENATRAASRGIPFVLSCDAHSVAGLGAMRWAVGIARRARIAKSQILNTLAPDELAERISPLRSGR